MSLIILLDSLFTDEAPVILVACTEENGEFKIKAIPLGSSEVKGKEPDPSPSLPVFPHVSPLPTGSPPVGLEGITEQKLSILHSPSHQDELLPASEEISWADVNAAPSDILVCTCDHVEEEEIMKDSSNEGTHLC